jgi:serine protease
MRILRVLFILTLFWAWGGAPLLAQTLPNDPFFGQQWHHLNKGLSGGLLNADLDSDWAWQIAQGGVTPAGDTIVVAVIDGGLDQLHPDLAPNLWRNRAEVPNDGLDNDQNGYVDDVRGWNVLKNSDEIGGLSAAHGTAVSGIIGARGNNGSGGSGVNWRVKIMFVATGGSVADVLAAYEYVRQARLRYNRTGGKEGAFVVAVNNSFGIDLGQPAQHPLWCAAFDSLGQAGILSVAATANQPLDVDSVGDLPSTCPSDFLVSVTSLNRADLKAPNAAWGKQHVDLGAYGAGVFSAAAVGGFGEFSGTSYAAPMVSGAVALLYSAPCPTLIAEAKTQPAAAARRVKKLLLQSASPNPSLLGLTLSGGRLNTASLLETYQDQCPQCPPPFDLEARPADGGQTALFWKQLSGVQSAKVRWRVLGTADWKQESAQNSPFTLPDALPCTDYEFAVKIACSPSAESDWSPALAFRSEGCCTPPAKLVATFPDPTSAEMSWPSVGAATGYRLRLRRANSNEWSVYEFAMPFGNIQNLQPCTDYVAELQTLCDASGGSDFSGPFFFKTKGCGACTEATYCSGMAENAEDEWISSVQIGDWSYVSGSGGAGYQNFTAANVEPLTLYAGKSRSVTVTPGFVGQPFKEAFRIYVDFNADGDFEDAGELAFDPGFAHNGPMSGTLAVPQFSHAALVRMRVMMKFSNSSAALPKPCESFGFGQVEDYCVQLLPLGPSSTDDFFEKNGTLGVFPQPAAQQVALVFPSGFFPEKTDLRAWDATGRAMPLEVGEAAAERLQLDVSRWPPGVYPLRATASGRVFWGKIVKT